MARRKARRTTAATAEPTMKDLAVLLTKAIEARNAPAPVAAPVVKAEPVKASEPTMSDLIAVVTRALRENPRQSDKGAETLADATDQAVGDDASLEDADLSDRRERSRKIYLLSPGAENRTHQIPDRPSSARKAFRYLMKYDAGVTKQIAHSLMLDKKTIGNGLAELMRVGLVRQIDLPK